MIHLEALCNEELDGNGFKSAAVRSYNLGVSSAITMSCISCLLGHCAWVFSRIRKCPVFIFHFFAVDIRV